MLLIVATQTSFAQKSSPVAGHVAELIDLLRKDYSALDPENKNEQLKIDRARIVTIFRTYVKDEILETTISSSRDTIKSEEAKLKREQRKLQVFELEKKERQGANPTTGMRSLSQINQDINSLESTIQNIRKNIVSAQYNIFITELDTIEAYYEKSNPYIEEIIKKFEKKYKAINDENTDGYARVNNQSSVQKSASFLSAGGFNINVLVEGLADFLAERIKAEITNYAMENIKKKLDPKQLKDESLLHELMALLPKTTTYIKQFEGEEILKFTDNFRAHIASDIKDLIKNIANLKTTPRFKKLIQKNPDIEFAFEAVELIPQLSSVDHPVDFFEKLETSKLIRTWSFSENKHKFNIANTIKTASLLTNSLLTVNANDSRRFASTQFMANYAVEPDFFMLFIGFLHQQNIKYYNIAFDRGNTLKYTLRFDQLMSNTLIPKNIKSTEANVQIISGALTSITDNAEKLYQEIEKIKRLSNDDEQKVDVETIHGFLNSFLGFFEDTLEASQTIFETSEKTKLLYNTDLNVSTDLGNFKKNITPYLATAKSVNNIVLQLHNKEYGLAIEEALTIPEKYTGQSAFTDKILSITNQLKTSEVFHLLKQTTINPITENDTLRIKKIYKKIAEIFEKNDILSDLKDKIKSLESITDFSTLKDSIEKIQPRFKDKAVKKELAKAFLHLELDRLENSILLYLLKKEGNVEEMKVVLNSIKETDFEIKLDNLQKKIKKDIVLKNNAKAYTSIIKEIKKNSGDIIDFKNKVETYSVNAIEYYLFQTDQSSLETSRMELLETFGKNILKQLTKRTTIKPNKEVTNIINFTTSIAKAENAKAVKEALESYALPTGSYTLKRNAALNVSINAYPGILYGYDINSYRETNTITMKMEQLEGSAIAITAPVGLSITPFTGNLSFFIPIIDIGAPLRLRLYEGDDKDTTIKKLPELSFENIFTPGFYLTYGLWDSPFALYGGVQYGPELAIEGDDITIADKSSWSLNIGVVVDIPLFTIYNRPR